MTKKTDAKAHLSLITSMSTSPEQSADYMPAMFRDEIEIIEDGISDVVTPAAVRMLAVDGLREPEAWEQKTGKSDNPVSMEADRLLSSEQFRLAVALSSFATSQECLEKSITRMTRAFAHMDRLANDFPEAAERFRHVAGEILSASYEVVKDNVLDEHARQNSTMRPLAQLKAAKHATIERARVIAIELWGADVAQEYRVKDMAVLVEDILKREGVADLPAVERIKEWIKTVAPGYARLGGRRKTP